LDDFVSIWVSHKILRGLINANVYSNVFSSISSTLFCWDTRGGLLGLLTITGLVGFVYCVKLFKNTLNLYEESGLIESHYDFRVSVCF
jgi:hypothetical protein